MKIIECFACHLSNGIDTGVGFGGFSPPPDFETFIHVKLNVMLCEKMVDNDR